MTRATPHQQISQIMRAIGAGRLGPAVEAARTLARDLPDDPDALSVLAVALARTGDLDEAIAHSSRAAELGGESRPDIVRGYAQLLRSAGRIPKAIAAFERLAGSSDDAEAWYGLALCYEQTRSHAEAVSAARRVLTHRPDHAMARVALARSLRASGEAESALGELAGIAVAGLPAVIAVHLFTERGHCLDRLGRVGEAFDAYTRANSAFDAMPETMRIAKDAFPSVIDRTHALLSSREWASRLTFAGPARAPVFVVGFPRSGTTMIEQMLGAHSGVITSDEAPFIRDVVRELDAIPGGYPGALTTLNEHQASGLRDRYWSLARRRLGPGVADKTLVDKQPLNLAYLACVGRLFPGARVVVVARDPMDAVLSCWMQAFTPNQATVHFSSLRRAAALYEKVMGLWLESGERCGVEAITVRYEDVLDDPRGQMSRCLAHAGLAWEQGVESFHEHIGRRFVSTPSYQSVGTPISRKSVGRWVRYHDHVEGVLPILERFRSVLGYGRSE